MQGMCVAALFGVGSTERLQTSQRVCDLSERLGDASALLRGLLNLAGAYLSGGEIARGLETSKRCVEQAKRSDNPEMLSAARMQLAACLRFSGELAQASLLIDELMRRTGSARQGAVAEFLPFNLWIETPVDLALLQHQLGRPDKALRLMDEALKRTRQLTHPLELAMALGCSAGLRCYRREPEAARSPAEASIAVAAEHGFGDWVSFGRAVRGWAMAESGQVVEGIAEVETNAALMSGLLQMLVFWTRAQMYIGAGRVDRAFKLLDEALARAERTGLHHDDAELHRLKGEAILLRDSSVTAEAENWFRKGIEIARRQSAKWWELRGTVSLARLLRDSGRCNEARAILALRLVHRGLRHRRPEGRQSAT
jgi:tetratricopeptide (TPR) repeat protein